MKRILATGATGFLGVHTTRLLKELGFESAALVRATSNLSLIENAVTDVMRTEPAIRLADVLEGYAAEAVVHMATDYGRQGTPVSDVTRTNLLFSLEVLEWAVARQARLFVNIDTCFTPDYPYLRPYTLSKKQFVTWGQTLCKDSDTKFVNLVVQHPFGPHDGAGKFVPWVMQECLTSQETIPLTSGEQCKDFIYVSDVSDAIRCILANVDDLPDGFSQFEVGRGNAISVRSFVETIHRLTASKATLDFGALPQRPGEIMHSEANIDSLVKLGWLPRISIEDGLTQTIANIQASSLDRSPQ